MRRILAALLVIVVWLAILWWPGDERRIARQIDELSEALNAPAGEAVGRIAYAARIGSFFSQDVTLVIGEPYAPISGREKVIALAARAELPPAGWSVEFVDVDIDVAPGGDNALVKLTATVSGPDAGTGQRVVEAREFELTMRPIEGEWLITRVQGVETLQRPRPSTLRPFDKLTVVPSMSRDDRLRIAPSSRGTISLRSP